MTPWGPIVLRRRPAPMTPPAALPPVDPAEASPDGSRRRVFGVPLAEARADVVGDCASELRAHLRDDATVLGLFSVAAEPGAVPAVVRRYELGAALPLGAAPSAHLAAAVLRRFLAAMPEPLMTHAAFDALIAAVQPASCAAQIERLRRVVDALPPANRSCLATLLPLLAGHGRRRRPARPRRRVHARGDRRRVRPGRRRRGGRGAARVLRAGRPAAAVPGGVLRVVVGRARDAPGPPPRGLLLGGLVRRVPGRLVGRRRALSRAQDERSARLVSLVVSALFGLFGVVFSAHVMRAAGWSKRHKLSLLELQPTQLFTVTRFSHPTGKFTSRHTVVPEGLDRPFRCCGCNTINMS